MVGLSKIGFIKTDGFTPAASACTTCARPISSPSSVIYELSAIFCDLNGAVLKPSCLKILHNAAAIMLFPALDIVPCIIIALATYITQLSYKFRVFIVFFNCNSVKAFIKAVKISAVPYQYFSL